MMAVRASASSKGAKRAPASVSFNRHSTAIAPCPTAGMQTSGESTSEIRWLKPRRSRPALATTTASYSPLSTFLNRVSTFPRRSRRSRSGRMCFTCACRRRLLVPTRAPCRRFANVEPTRQSRTSSRRQTAGNISREGMSVGTSFTLCTARSIVSSSSASSSSLINIPFPPICGSGARCILSPLVLMMTISASTPVAANSCLRTDSACHLASMLPRVPIRRILTASPGSKETDRATPRRFESFAGVLSRLAGVPPVPEAASPASHPSIFQHARGPSPSDASSAPCASG